MGTTDSGQELRAFDTGEFPVVWREERDGFEATIAYDEETGCGDPRDADNLGMIVHWHRRYDVASDAESVDAIGEFKSIAHIKRYLELVRHAVCVVPLGMLDHSGVSFYAGGGEHWCDPGGWDSGQVGFVYTTAERVRELCGEYPYKPADYAGTAEEWLAEALRGDIRALDAYARGEVFYHRIVDATGEVVDDCYGYLNVPGEGQDDGLDWLRSEVHDALVGYVDEERVERERAANQDVATVAA